VIVVSLGTNDFNLALGEFPEREAFVSSYVAFLRALRAEYALAQIVLTEGAIVNDGERPQKSVLRAYVAEAVRRIGDSRVRAAPSNHYPGDACDVHPTRDQHAAMARELEPVLRAAVGWWAAD